jgi:putative transposase
MNCADWSITTTLSSVSAANVRLLGLPRSTLYYRPTPVRESTLRIMARIDALYLEDPCSGSRRMVGYLARDGIPISRDRVRNLMHRMRLRAIYQKPRTTVPGDPSERFPCLVDLSTVTAVDQVWAADIERHEAPWERAVMKGHRHRPVAAGR